MMNDTKTDPDPTPFPHLQVQSPEGLDYQLDIAGMGARSHAFVIDWHIRVLLALTWFCAIGFGLFSLKELRALIYDFSATAPVLLLLVPTAGIYFFYHPLLEWLMAGRTPGKRMAGVRLVDRHGHTPGLGAILLRNVFRLIDGLPGFYLLGLVSVALTRHHVRIGDLAAGLVLVYDNTVKPKNLRQITGLSLSSTLSAEDQSLLVDLLARWQELPSDTRTRFARLFLARIGQPAPELVGDGKSDAVLKQALEKLLA